MGTWIIGIVLIVGAIAVAVFVLRKYVPGLKPVDTKEDELQNARDNIARLVVDPKVEKKEQEEEDESQDLEDESGE